MIIAINIFFNFKRILFILRPLVIHKSRRLLMQLAYKNSNRLIRRE